MFTTLSKEKIEDMGYLHVLNVFNLIEETKVHPTDIDDLRIRSSLFNLYIYGWRDHRRLMWSRFLAGIAVSIILAIVYIAGFNAHKRADTSSARQKTTEQFKKCNKKTSHASYDHCSLDSPLPHNFSAGFHIIDTSSRFRELPNKWVYPFYQKTGNEFNHDRICTFPPYFCNLLDCEKTFIRIVQPVFKNPNRGFIVTGGQNGSVFRYGCSHGFGFRAYSRMAAMMKSDFDPSTRSRMSATS